LRTKQEPDIKVEKKLDKPLHDLINAIRFLECVSAKVHGCLSEAEIYKTIIDEFAKSKRYTVSIFLLSDDDSEIRFAETSLPPALVKVGEKAVGVQSYKDYSFQLLRSSFFSQVVREGKIIEASFADVISELLPRQTATLLPSVIGYVKRSGVLAPLRRHDKIIGVLVVDSLELSSYLIPSVRNFATHISTALELVGECAERERAQEALRRSEERFCNIVENANDCIVFLDMSGKICEINRRAIEVFGGSKDELLGKHFADVSGLSSRDLPRLLTAFQKALTGEAVTLSLTFRNKKNQEILLEGMGSFVRTNSGPLGIIIIARDVTERQRMEEDLAQERDLLHILLDNIPDGIYFKDDKSCFTRINREQAQRIQVDDPEAAIGKTDFDFFPEHFAKEAYEDEQRILKSGQPLIGKIEKVTLKDGRIRWASATKVPIRERSGQITGLVGISRDITEHKNAEELLRENEEKYRSLVENSIDGIAIVQGDEIRFVNWAVLEMFGCQNADEMVGHKVTEFTAPESQNLILERGYARERGENVPNRYEFKALRKNGTAFNAEISVSRIFHQGHFARQCIIRDVTERKKAEQELRDSEERYRRLFEQSPIGIGIGTIEGTIVDMNPAMQAITGYSREDIGKVNVIDAYSNPEQRKKLLESLKQYGHAQDFLVRKRRKDGILYDALLYVSQINIDGKVFLQTMCQDVTEKKKIEKDVKSRLMKFRLEDGNIYLAREIVPALSVEAFKDLLRVGYHGLVISRTPKEEFQETVEGAFEYLWLAERPLENTLNTGVEGVKRFVERQPSRTVVLFDRVDYLVSRNGFSKILFLVQSLREIAYLSGNIIILSIDPATIGSYELKLLEKETRQILPRFISRFPEDMLEILRFVFKQNNLGIKPNYTDVKQEVGVSKPTAIKRIRHLIATGYVSDSLKGRSKVLELT